MSDFHLDWAVADDNGVTQLSAGGQVVSVSVYTALSGSGQGACAQKAGADDAGQSALRPQGAGPEPMATAIFFDQPVTGLRFALLGDARARARALDALSVTVFAPDHSQSDPALRDLLEPESGAMTLCVPGPLKGITLVYESALAEHDAPVAYGNLRFDLAGDDAHAPRHQTAPRPDTKDQTGLDARILADVLIFDDAGAPGAAPIPRGDAPHADPTPDTAPPRRPTISARALRNAFAKPRPTTTLQRIEDSVPCLTSGTAIATPQGDTLVQELRVGDRVLTRDHGVQELRWIGSRHLGLAELSAAPHLRPILIQKGALGDGLPDHDMLVSPNQRLWVGAHHTMLPLDQDAALIAAKNLVNHRGVHPVEVISTTYWALMFDVNPLVRANGSWCECLPEQQAALQGPAQAQRRELAELFTPAATGAADPALAAAPAAAGVVIRPDQSVFTRGQNAARDAERAAR